MDRQSLLEDLQQYQPHNELEGAHQGAIIAFMLEHEDCFERSNLHGHLTGSGWIVDEDYSHCLLVHHRKLDRWLQPGGHADGNPNIQEVAEKEVREETGLASFLPVPGIFDVDVHRIPAKNFVPEHYHYDVRFLFISPLEVELRISEESNAVKWVPFPSLPQYVGDEESILRMLEKSQFLPGTH